MIDKKKLSKIEFERIQHTHINTQFSTKKIISKEKEIEENREEGKKTQNTKKGKSFI